MDAVKRFAAAATLIVGSIALGLAAGGLPDIDPGPARYSVTGLLEARPIGEEVLVRGNVSRVLDDYVSDSGNRYHQFMLSDGTGEVKVFCRAAGNLSVEAGAEVRVQGTFKQFYGTDEIYTGCGAVRPG